MIQTSPAVHDPALWGQHAPVFLSGVLHMNLLSILQKQIKKQMRCGGGKGFVSNNHNIKHILHVSVLLLSPLWVPGTACSSRVLHTPVGLVNVWRD